MRTALKVVGWTASTLLIALALWCGYLLGFTHSGVTALKISGSLLVYGGLATTLAAAATVNPMVNGRLRFLKTGLRQFLLGLTLTTLLAVFSFSAWGAWEGGEDALAKGNPGSAISQLRFAAKYGPEGAMYTLARAYWSTKPPVQDSAQAFAWMKRAAEAEVNNKAPLFLGLFYQKGIGTPVDLKAAATWYQKAAEAGDATAASALGDVLYASDPSAAIPWYVRAVEGGYADAAYELGLSYEKGEGVAKDTAAAARYYKIAADSGNVAAQLNYGSLLYNGDGIAQDVDAAIHYFEQASNSDDTDIRNLAAKNLAIARR